MPHYTISQVLCETQRKTAAEIVEKLNQLPFGRTIVILYEPVPTRGDKVDVEYLAEFEVLNFHSFTEDGVRAKIRRVFAKNSWTWQRDSYRMAISRLARLAEDVSREVVDILTSVG